MTPLKPLHSKLYFLVLFGDWKLFLRRNIFQDVLVFVNFFCPKNSRTGSLKTSITRELLDEESWAAAP